ncbi:MAG TPA: hypothetical protein PLH70_08250 [Bacteroidales bacterium]|nr:hypothetical protein [Bacteroidales bacterium]HQB75775.1 hypothetical protein [Bacteroidales bacterium]
MKRLIFLISFLFCIIFSFGQDNVKKYYEYVNKAELAICDFQYEKAAQYYEKAFNSHTPFAFDLYNAARLNIKFTKNFDIALQYAKILKERDSDGIYYAIDATDTINMQRFKSVEDGVKPLVNKELMSILDQMLKEDQKQANTPQEKYEKYQNIFVKLFELKKEYGPLTEQKIGLYEYSPIQTILIHAAQNQMSPQDLLLQDVLDGNVYAENYMHYFDLYLEYTGQTPRYGYGWFSIFISNDVLFIIHPDDIAKNNREREKINVAETWEDYVKKAKYQFLYGKFQIVPRSNYVTDEEEIKMMMQEIDEEHQKGIYKREYVVREKN